MIAYQQELMFTGKCDNCLTTIPAGTIAWYNPLSRKVYCHDGCLEEAEVGDL
jgi:hypothetical protein